MEGTWPKEINVEEEDKTTMVNCDVLKDDEGSPSEISLHAIAGTLAPQTMKIKESLKYMSMVVLIDSSSTHNFLDYSLAMKSGLLIHEEEKIEVMVANGDKLTCKGRSFNMKLSLQKELVVADFFLLPLGGCDIVLGA